MIKSDNFTRSNREKSNIAIAILDFFSIAPHLVIALGRAITFEREPSKKKQRTNNKKDAKMIKSDNFTRSNREKSNIAIPIQ
jgi:hypothetical protein